LYAQNGISRPSGVSCSTQHFMSCFTFRVYGSWKSWITTMNAFADASRTAAGSSIVHVAQVSCSATDPDPATAEALHSFSSAPRIAGSGSTRFVT
jgi:hypothetical protein